MKVKPIQLQQELIPLHVMMVIIVQEVIVLQFLVHQEVIALELD